MARYDKCIARLTEAAGRELTDKEVEAIYTRIHKAALDIKAGRETEKFKSAPKAEAGGRMKKEVTGVIEQAANEAAEQLKAEAAQKLRQAHLQITRLAARTSDYQTAKAAGLKDFDAVIATITRNYTGKINIESLEQRVAGHRADLERKLMPTWDALGDDFLGFFQDKSKLLTLIRELRGEDTGDALAKKGAKAFHDTAEEARLLFNAAGGEVGKLDDWGMPQHHSQEKVAGDGSPEAREKWVNDVYSKLDISRYVDDAGQPWTEERTKDFLWHAWDTISTNGHANTVPGEFSGSGKRANAHSEERQIHFKDAQSTIDYWRQYGERTALEILHGHISTMARDIAFIEHFGPDPNLTYRTLRDTALQNAVLADRPNTKKYEGQSVALDNLWEVAAGHTKPTLRPWVSNTADVVRNLNTAGKLGGASLASLFGDKVTMEAVSHLNNVPVLRRWFGGLNLYNPLDAADRAAVRRQGLMLEGVRSGLNRFADELGKSSITGKIANAVMRLTGMNAVNDIRKGGFGLDLMASIGHELNAGRNFADLADGDVRVLRNFGINEGDWNTWKLAQRETLAGADNVLTPESISRIPDDDLKAANIIGQADGPDEAQAARKNAIVKLLGAVNTEGDFAIVTPGWKEKNTFYGGLQRGTVKGELWPAIMQFKSFPWAFLMRGMDLVANQNTPASKAAMTAYIIGATTVAGAMILQTREVLSGKDPRNMAGKDAYKFWLNAFIQGGALGIYGDFLYSVNQTRYGSGPIEALSGPTLGPLMDLALVNPLNAAEKRITGNDNTHLAAQTVSQAKGFIPGNNMWYTKAAMDHLIWFNVMEALSPGYLATIRSNTIKQYGQDWYYQPGELVPSRPPDLPHAVNQ